MGNKRPEAAYWWGADAESRFARRAKELREQRDMTQAALAAHFKELGVPMYQSSIAKMEMPDPEGRRPIRLNEAVTLAYIFGESLEVMLLGPQEEHAEKISSLEAQIRDLEAEMYAATDDFEDRLNRLRTALEHERHQARTAQLKNLHLNREINHIDPAETARRARKRGRAKS